MPQAQFSTTDKGGLWSLSYSPSQLLSFLCWKRILNNWLWCSGNHRLGNSKEPRVGRIQGAGWPPSYWGGLDSGESKQSSLPGLVLSENTPGAKRCVLLPWCPFHTNLPSKRKWYDPDNLSPAALLHGSVLNWSSVVGRQDLSCMPPSLCKVSRFPTHQSRKTYRWALRTCC